MCTCRYKEVLDVHLNYIGDLRAVEEFCNRIEKRSKPMEKSIYVQMLEVSSSVVRNLGY